MYVVLCGWGREQRGFPRLISPRFEHQLRWQIAAFGALALTGITQGNECSYVVVVSLWGRRERK